MVSEEQIRAWVRDEESRIRAERQEACDHAAFGTLHNDGRVTCQQCDKELTREDWGLGAPPYRGYLERR